jgi:CHAT domain
MKILILSSNPRNDLDLDEEIRDLKDVIDDSRNRQNFQVEDALAVRAGDLQELLFRHEPQIVHFCGHGGGQPGLAFEGKNGGEQWVETEALRDLFRLFSHRVTCVLLNACYSEQQANEIVHHIDYVIGMNQAIRDDAAIAFSKGFYRALGYNCSIEEAYEFGCNAIQLELSGGSISRDGNPQERKLQGVSEPNTIPPLPEHLKPILKKRAKTQPQPLPIPTAERQQLQKEVVQAVTGFGPRPIAPPRPPASPKTILQHRAAPYFIGGLVAFLIPAIGLYR